MSLRGEDARLLTYERDLNAPVLLAARRRFVARDRLGFAVTDGVDPRAIKPHRGQRRSNG